MAGYGRPLILDWSAYTRVLVAIDKGLGNRRLTASQLQRFEDAVLSGELHVCPPFRLEARFSARSASDFATLDETLAGFEQAQADQQTFGLALSTQQDLAGAKGVSHRVKPVDLLVAALAHQHGLGVLHYDNDFDTLARKTSLTFASTWITPRGTID